MERIIELEGPCNFRTLSGIPTVDGRKIKQNVLFRSDELSALSNNDWEKLKEFGIGKICDLRRRDEFELYPTKVPEGLNVELLWWNFDDESLQAMKEMGDKIRAALAPLATFNEEQLNAWVASQYIKYHHGFYMCSHHLKEIIKEASKDDFKPMIIHCGAGKDRTGYAISLILHALNVSIDDILDDYFLTTPSYLKRFPTMEHLKPLLEANALDQLPENVIKKLSYAYREALETALNKIVEENGSILEFMKKNLEVTDATIEALKRNLLE